MSKKDLMCVIMCEAHDMTREVLSNNDLIDVDFLTEEDFSYKNIFRSQLSIAHSVVRESA